MWRLMWSLCSATSTSTRTQQAQHRGCGENGLLHMETDAFYAPEHQTERGSQADTCGSLKISTSRKEQSRVGIKENKLQPHSLHGTVMIDDFNLLATTARGNERAMCNELFFLLKDNLQDAEAKTSKTKIRGLIVAKTALEPVGVMEKFRCILTEQPYAFRYALRIVPIERVVPTELEAIKKAAAELAAPKIGEGQSFPHHNRETLHRAPLKRHHRSSSGRHPS